VGDGLCTEKFVVFHDSNETLPRSPGRRRVASVCHAVAKFCKFFRGTLFQLKSRNQALRSHELRSANDRGGVQLIALQHLEKALAGLV